MNKTYPIAPRHGLMMIFQFIWLGFFVAAVYFGAAYFLGLSQKTFLIIAGLTTLLYILGIFVILIQSYKRLGQGQITFTDTGMHWNIKNTNQQLNWAQPLSATQGVFYRQLWRYAISVPMLSCEIKQGDTQVVFVREANLNEVQGLPKVKSGGIYLAVHGREIMNEILSHTN